MQILPFILTFHHAAMGLSLLIYIVRAVLMLMNSPAVAGKALIAGASASMLLIIITGLWMAFAGTHGFDGFVVTKALGLVAYVLLGVIALKPGLGKVTAIILWVAGLAAFITTALVGKHILPALY